MTETSQTTTLIAATLQETIRQLPSLKQSINLEESRAPRFSQTLTFLIFMVLIGSIGLAAITPIYQKITSSGEIIASDKIKVVQHNEGGVITNLMIQEGELVKQGQPLIVLDSSATRADLDAVTDKEQLLQIIADRLRAFGLNQDFDISHYPNSLEKIVADQKSIYDIQVRNQEEQRLNMIKQLEQRRTQLALTLEQEHDLRQQMEVAEQQRNMAKKLYEKKLGTGTDYRKAEASLLKLQNELNALISKSQEKRQEIMAEEGRIIELDTTSRNNALKEMWDMTTQLATLNEQKSRLKDSLERLTIKSPLTGIVRNLQDLKVGEKLQPDKPIFEIVPLESIEAELKVNPQEAKEIKVGQYVQVTVGVYASQFNGIAEGKVLSLSEAPLLDANNQPYYKVRVILDKSYIGTNPKQNPLIPGMTLTAKITTNQKNLLEYLWPFSLNITNSL